MGRVALEELRRQDLPVIEAILEACEDYFVLTTGGPAPPAAAHALFTQLPNGCSHKDKHVLGICDVATRELMGLIDAMVGYPDLHTCTLGLFLILPRWVGSPVAPEAYALLEQWARGHAASRIRTAAHEALADTVSFFRQAGFRPTDEQVRDGDHTILVFEKRLFGAPGRR